MVLEIYEEIAGFNLEGYYISSSGGISLAEFIPTVGGVEELSEIEEYLGVYFVVDNIEKRIFVFQDERVKTKKQVKGIKSEKKDGKLLELANKIFEKELEYDITSYDVKCALTNMEIFKRFFKFQINEFPLYKQHYVLPEFEGEDEGDTSEETAAAEVSSNLKECANCGWMMSANLTVCPKCRRSPREKFEGKQ